MQAMDIVGQQAGESRNQVHRFQQDNRPEVASEGGKRIRDEIGDLYGENPRQVTRYIRLTYLTDKLLTLVDTGKLKMGTAIAISYLNSETQAWVESYYEEKEVFPNNSQIKEIRRLSEAGTLTCEYFDALMAERPGKRKEPEDFIAGLREEYFPNMMDEDVKIKLRELVEEYFHRKNMLGYSQEEEALTMLLKYDGEPFDERDSENILSLKLAQNTSHSIDYAECSEGGFTNLVTVKIK
ncbi:MAG: hypothetical protein IJD86_02685 [Clostridia bacterium]|nr:hypothetical protein [Clostridia bacterium]